MAGNDGEAEEGEGLGVVPDWLAGPGSGIFFDWHAAPKIRRAPSANEHGSREFGGFGVTPGR